MNQMVERHAGLDDSLHEQNIFIGHIHSGGENDFAHRTVPRRLVVHLRLHEVANDRWAEQANQIRHEEKAVPKDADDVHGLARVIAVDLASQFLDAPANAARVENHAQVVARGQRFRNHLSPPDVFTLLSHKA